VFTSNGSSPILDTVPLDANYFMIISGQFSSSDLASEAFFLNTRVVRYVDANFAQCSAATTNGDGVSIGSTSYALADQNFLFRDGSDSVYLFGRSSSLGNAAAQIKVLYQAGG
jgi:hypothetical protein